MKRRGPHEGSVYRRKDGTWAGAVHIGYRDGKRIRKVVYGNTRLIAQERLHAVVKLLDQGQPTTADRQTVGPFLRRWLEDVARPTVRVKTYVGYESIIRCHLIPSLGHVRLVDLSPEDVQAMLTEKSRSGLAPRTVVAIRAVLRDALARAVRWGLLTRNVAALVDGPRVEHRDVEFLNPDQAKQLIEATRGTRNEALYLVPLGLGLRQGEALGLSWADIDLEGRTARVRHALSRASGRAELVEPKTSRSRRVVALPEFVVASLRSHRVQQLEDRLLAGGRWVESGLVFTTSIGTPMDGPTVTRRLKKVLADAGLPTLRYHDLRHSFASIWLAQGVDARVVMEALGHSDVRVTQNTYQHVLPSLQRDAADKMDALLGVRERSI